MSDPESWFARQPRSVRTSAVAASPRRIALCAIPRLWPQRPARCVPKVSKELIAPKLIGELELSVEEVRDIAIDRGVGRH